MSELVKSLEEAGIDIGPEKTATLKRYLEELKRWSKTFALISRKSESEPERQAVDSLLLLKTGFPGKDACFADIGSGAGFPAIPLKIAFPALRVTLIEQNRKKAAFLKHITRELKLDDIEVFQGRAEQVALTGKRFPLITAKAMADPARTCEAGLPLTEEGGRLVIYCAAGIKSWRSGIEKAGGSVIGSQDIFNPAAGKPTRLLFIQRKNPADGSSPAGNGF